MAKPKLPKSQKQIQRELITPYNDTTVPVFEDGRDKRALNRRVDDTSPLKTISIGLKDIDETIVYYFNNVIRPSVVQNGVKINVPILYGSPERWSAVQRDGFYRDKNGKIITPLIMFKRDSVEKNRSLGNKLDANNPRHFQIFEKKYSNKNKYDRFSVLSNREPVKEYYAVVIPDYVNITYSCVVFTDYVEQMNKLVESINYASDAYWGDPEKFNFRAMIDNYTTAVELNKGQDRAVKTSFSIKMLGHIIPDTINTELLGSRKFFSKSRVFFNFETERDLETLTTKAKTPVSQAPVRYFDSPIGAQGKGMTLDQILFVTTSNFAIASTTVGNVSTFLNKTILTPPPGFVLDEDSFTVYVNGVAINPSHVLIEQDGPNITATFNPSLIGYDVNGGDTVIITGKLK